MVRHWEDFGTEGELGVCKNGKGTALAVPQSRGATSASAAEVGAAEWIFLRLRAQASADRILQDVITMNCEVAGISNAMICKPTLPDFSAEPEFLFQTKRVSAFDVLHALLQTVVARRSDQQMYVVRHDHESVQQNLCWISY